MKVGARVAFVTSRGASRLSPDDVPAAEALRLLGIEASPADWTDAAALCAEFDAVVLRSCHDYTPVAAEFVRWLDRVVRAGGAVWNPPAVIGETIDKKYLLRLAAAGVPTLPTVRVDAGCATDLGEVADQRGWVEFVVKPAVSASGRDTYRVTRKFAPEFQPYFNDLLARGPVLIQPFAKEILEEGEWSLVFFDRVYNHAVVKRPGANEFRVQPRYGGTIRPATPPADLLRVATDALKQITGPLLYARVDAIASDNEYFVCELELIEPCLYLRSSPTAAERFADAIAGIIGHRCPPTDLPA